jgi:hypothetical protein
VSAKQLAKPVGMITALHHAFGGVVYLYTKACQVWITSQPTWGALSVLPTDCQVEVRFWIDNIDSLNRKSFEQCLPDYTRIVYMDASGFACGGFLKGHIGSELIQQWTQMEKTFSSTWRGLRTVLIFLKTYALLLSSQQALFYTDNAGVKSILKKGSMKVDLQLIASHRLVSFVDSASSVFNSEDCHVLSKT